MTAATRLHFGPFERLVLALAFVTQAAFFPWFPELRSPNELTRVYLAESLVDDASVSIDGAIARHGSIFDLSVREVDGHRRHYSDKAPGLAFLATPFIALYHATSSAPDLNTQVRLTRFVTATLPTFILLVLLLRFLRSELVDRRLPAILVLGYALGTVATPYSGLAFGHQLSACILFSLFLAIRADKPRAPLVGLLASAAVLVEYQNALLLLPFAIWFLARVRLSPRHLALAVLGMAPLTALLLVYHHAAFGSPFLTGYSFIASSFAEVHAQGLLGVTLPKLSAANLSFISPAKGLFFFSPWLALALPGLFLLDPRGPHRFTLVFVVIYALFVSSLVYPDGGWTVSQRHLAPMVPFLILPIGLLIDRRRSPFAPVLVGLLIPSIAACTISAVVWPHWQDHLQNPFWQLGWPLFADGWVPASALAFISSWWLLVTLLGLASLCLLAYLLEPLILRHRYVALLATAALTTAIAATYIALARLPGRTQDVERDRQFIERTYVPDPRSTALTPPQTATLLTSPPPTSAQ